jgi:hypothetical protein
MTVQTYLPGIQLTLRKNVGRSAGGGTPATVFSEQIAPGATVILNQTFACAQGDALQPADLY